MKKKQSKFNILKNRFLEEGDLLYESNCPINPACMLANGDFKKYKWLNTGDEVWIKENGQYKKGKITASSYKNHDYVYNVETKSQEGWRLKEDFRISDLLCLKKVAPNKRVVDLNQ